jgi:hypothetical protein
MSSKPKSLQRCANEGVFVSLLHPRITLLNVVIHKRSTSISKLRLENPCPGAIRTTSELD